MLNIKDLENEINLKIVSEFSDTANKSLTVITNIKTNTIKYLVNNIKANKADYFLNIEEAIDFYNKY